MHRYFALLITATILRADTAISVSASRSFIVPVTQANFAIEATPAAANVPFTDVLAAVRPTGVGIADLSGSRSLPAFNPSSNRVETNTVFTFVLRVPSSDLASTATRLTGLVNTANSSANARVRLGYVLTGQSPSAADLRAARARVLPELWTELRGRAEALAAAANRGLERLAILGYGLSSAQFGLDDFALLSASLGRGGSAPSQVRQTLTIAATFSDVGPGSIQVASSLPDTTPPRLALSLTVTGPLSLTLSQALQRLQALNVTQDHLVSAAVNSPVSISSTTGAQTVGAPNQASWVFQLLVPEAELAATLARAEQASQATAEGAVAYAISGIGTEAQAIRDAAPGAWSTILQDCRAGAEDLANAAGVGVGELRAVGDQSSALALLGQSRSLGYALSVTFDMNR